MAVIATALAILLRWVLDPLLGATSQYLLFYFSVMLVATVAGVGPGLLAILLGGIGGTWFFVYVDHVGPSWADDIGRLALFLVFGGVVTALAGRLHAAKNRADARAGELALAVQQRQEAERHIQQLNLGLEQRNAELDAERKRWQAVVEGIAEEVWVCDEEGKISLVNLSTVTAMKLAAFKDKSVYEVLEEVEILSPDGQERPPEQAPLLRALRGENVRGEEIMRHRRTGITRWRQFSSAPMRDAAGEITGAVAIVRDITDYKQMELDLKAARDSAERAKAEAEHWARDAEAASKAKDHFLAVLSHELRTPLTPVVTALSMLQNQESLDPAMRGNLEMIHRNVEMEARLIDDLLDVTRIARGKIELDRKPIQLCEVIRRAVEVVQSDIEARRLHFGVNMPDAPYIVDADAVRLQQVVWNLLRNAIKFTPHGGHVGIRCRRVDGMVVVEVNDSGEGIEPAALSRIFNAFEQAERSITRQFGGLGLGLAISKALVEMHGGTIDAFSEGKGTGAVFRVRLPLIAAKPHVEVPPAAPPPVRPLRILLVEDHGDTAKMMQQLLVLDGHNVERAGDVATALDLLSQQAFDLLLSDLGLPDRSGLDLMRELRARGMMMPGIALSGYGQEDDIRRSKEAGFAAHLTKPTSPERLIEAIAIVAGSASMVVGSAWQSA